MSLRVTSRQQALLEAPASYVYDSHDIGAMVLLGSFVNGTADAVSDLDLFFIAYEDRLGDAWPAAMTSTLTELPAVLADPSRSMPTPRTRWVEAAGVNYIDYATERDHRGE
jgi:predicted nucleotidyltransferase